MSTGLAASCSLFSSAYPIATARQLSNTRRAILAAAILTGPERCLITWPLRRRSGGRLDDLLGPDFRCNLVKIDVEGHELQVLDGMKRIVENSPDIKILFEKLTPNS